MPEPLVRISGVSRHFSRGGSLIKAVDDVSIDIERGDCVALVGASGSGKSTLLNLIAGLDTPTSGEIFFEGRSLKTMSRRELARYRARRVGMIFQSFNLLSHQTARRNVEMALYFGESPRRDYRKRTDAMLTRVGLGDRMEHRPMDLSGGEQQRVAIARALVKNPDLILADEPTGNLDRDNSAEVAAILADLNRSGLTVIVVTHDTAMAGKIAKRTLRLDYGRIAGNSGGSVQGVG